MHRLCLLGCLWAMGLRATLAATGPTNAASSPTNSTPAPALRQVSDSVFEFGNVRFDKNARTISFPAKVNMREDAIEYVLVHSSGKVHESVLATETEPYQIHIAAALLGWMIQSTNAASTNPASRSGQPIRISVTWTNTGEAQTTPIEDLILNTSTKAALSRGPWVYNGSRISDGVFVAQRDGSITAIIDDVDAMINNPRPQNENDDIWRPITEKIPPKGTQVQVTFKAD